MRRPLRALCVRAAQLAAVSSLAALASHAAAPAEIGTFTGGDPGEGLDLQGNFVYAVNVGPDGAAGKVGDADFTADNVTGVNIAAQNNIGDPGWLQAIYGDTENDLNLARVMNSIRWSASPAVVTVRLAVEPSVEYKLQILFGEDCCQGRGFNIVIDGVTEAVNFMPARIQMGDTGDFEGTKEVIGAVVTKTIVTTGAELTFVLDGAAAGSPDINDRNAILNGFTLEKIRTATLEDTDADGLPDLWETKYFGNLTETGTGDFDSDGLTNVEENTLLTDPTKKDSDGDGLEDGPEVKVHKTNPANIDSDGDFLADGDEINRYKTDPAKKDTDGDGASDYDEVRLLTDATKAESKPQRTSISLFTGADSGEGLDLQGSIVYAINMGALGEVVGQIGDAAFTDESAGGVNFISGNKTDLNWNAGINYGDTPEDDLLEQIMGSISWSDAARPVSDVSLTLSDLEVGAQYKLQLLCAEQQWPRGFDVYVDGAFVADDFSPAVYQGGVFPPASPSPDDRGVVLTHSFVARKSEVTIVLDGKTVTTPQITDHNAILNAATLERVSAKADADNDGLPDAWETEYFGNTAQTATADPDGDGVANSAEFADGTNPNAADTDNDGLSDSQEKTAGTNPNMADTDSDGLSDGAEVNTHTTNPLSADSDSDGKNDGFEVNVAKSNPNKSETGAIIGSFTGGDPGEGLDLQGTFLYAFSVGTEFGAGQVGDAMFTGQTVDGVTILQAPSMAESWYNPVFGDTTDDAGLALAVSSIRHGGGGARIILSNLVAGSAYKVQLLFGEQCCARGMDIEVDGKQIVDEFAPFVVMRGINNLERGAVVTYNFIAKTNVVEVRTRDTVTTPAYTDHNPIINAVTLEEVAANVDSDNDGLPDPWETFYLGGLSGTATGDPDNDGLNNLAEFQFGTDPQDADADGDGLNDGQEKQAGTNPSVADTDGDGLSDAAEVNTHHTDPLATDPDHDGLPDPVEIAQGSNPNVADTGVNVGAFTGGDPGEGLDLQGNFVYAFSVLPDTTAVGTVGDATFTSENVEGVSVTQATSQIPAWFVPEFGSTANDDALELIVQNIRHGGGGATIALSNLVVGTSYKLQLIFGEQCCNRGMDILVDGKLIADEFAPYEVQGGINNTAKGAVVAYEFVATTNTVVVQTVGTTVTTPRYTDRNPIINAVTLENQGTAAAPPRISSITLQAGVAIVFESIPSRTYGLEYKAKLSDAAWQSVGTVTATGPSTTIRDDTAGHATGTTGFWRIRTQ